MRPLRLCALARGCSIFSQLLSPVEGHGQDGHATSGGAGVSPAVARASRPCRDMAVTAMARCCRAEQGSTAPPARRTAIQKNIQVRHVLADHEGACQSANIRKLTPTHPERNTTC